MCLWPEFDSQCLWRAYREWWWGSQPTDTSESHFFPFNLILSLYADDYGSHSCLIYGQPQAVLKLMSRLNAFSHSKQKNKWKALSRTKAESTRELKAMGGAEGNGVSWRQAGEFLENFSESAGKCGGIGDAELPLCGWVCTAGQEKVGGKGRGSGWQRDRISWDTGLTKKVDLEFVR